MHLHDLGWNAFFASAFADLNRPDLLPARVVEECKGFHRVRSEQAEYLAEISGKVRHRAPEREHLPAVGDWVAIIPHGDGRARTEHILPRKTKLVRKVAGRALSEQIVATNLDTVFVVTSLNRDFNLRRLERYLAIVWESGALPVVLLNKTDLSADPAACASQAEAVAPGVPVYLLSALHGTGLDSLRQHLRPGETAALVGSSGVGKSTIINALMGAESLPVQPVREGDDRGRHTTSSRQMIVLPEGGIVIDTPGMRELQPWDSEQGLERGFEDIAALARNCRFRDCRHGGEPGCAVAEAILNGELEPERFENQRKLQAELRFQQRKADPQIARQVKEEWRRIHKAMRAKPPHLPET